VPRAVDAKITKIYSGRSRIPSGRVGTCILTYLRMPRQYTDYKFIRLVCDASHRAARERHLHKVLRTVQVVKSISAGSYAT